MVCAINKYIINHGRGRIEAGEEAIDRGNKKVQHVQIA
jgi:hypothetical protein